MALLECNNIWLCKRVQLQNLKDVDITNIYTYVLLVCHTGTSLLHYNLRQHLHILDVHKCEAEHVDGLRNNSQWAASIPRILFYVQSSSAIDVHETCDILKFRINCHTWYRPMTCNTKTSFALLM